LITHALFNEGTMDSMRAAGIDFVGSTDSVAHPSNVVGLAPLLASAIQRLR
jgi:ribose-phosphate pyrophosphokinase